MNRLFVASGPPGIVEAAQALYDSDQYDMAVVRGVCAPDSETLNALSIPSNGKHQIREHQIARLRDELSQLEEIHHLIVKNWAINGYAGMRIRDGFYLDQLRDKGIPPHVDGLICGGSLTEAGLQLSLCLRGRRRFSSERLAMNVRTSLGGLSVDAYNNQTGRGSTLAKEIWNGRTPRTSGELGAGDMAIFPHHPVVSLHSAQHLTPDSLGRLISYNAQAEAVEA